MSAMRSKTKRIAYGDDLAYIHDAGFGGFAREAGSAVLELFRAAGTVSGLVVDLGCGSGIWARQLVENGYDVFGVDISASMIALARKNAPRATFAVGSLLEARLPRCRAVTAMGECVNYAFDPKNSASKLARLFRRVHRSLEPGGLFVFDSAGPGRLGGPSPVRRFFEGEGWTILVDAAEDRQKMTLTRRITTFRRSRKLYRRSEEVHVLNLYLPGDLATLLRQANFEVKLLPGYGASNLPGGLTVFVARKPGT
jgi:SAM-dependent methyltransferase